MASKGCDVRSFDPSMGSTPKHWRGPKHLFEPVGIGPKSGTHQGPSTLFGGGTNYAVFSLADLMARNNHSRIDVLRMDVESAEWAVLESWQHHQRPQRQRADDYNKDSKFDGKGDSFCGDDDKGNKGEGADTIYDVIGQLLVEVHMWDDILQDAHESTSSNGNAQRFSTILRNIPMDLFSAKQNIYDGNFVLLDQMTRIYELGFVGRTGGTSR